MMSRPQKYIEGQALHSQREKSNNALKLRVAVLVVCVLLVSALVVIYLLFELLKTREMLRNLELKQVTVKTDVTERLPEIKPCSTVQPTCPEPKVKIITEPCNTLPTTTLQPPEINMLTQSYSTISPTSPQPPDITTVTQSYSTIPPTSPQPLDITTVTQSYSTILPTSPQPLDITTVTQSYSTISPTSPQPLDITTDDPCYKCEDGWKQHGGKCYFFSTSKSSWNESSTGCITKGGGLVKIDSKEEQSFLRIAIQQKIESYDDLFWIGLTHSAVEGRWLWVDGSPLNESLTFWYSREPDDLTGEDPDGENCAKMGKTYWFDRSCKVTDRSICEKPAVALCV